MRQDVGRITLDKASATKLSVENKLRPPTGRAAAPLVAAAFSATGDELVTLDGHGQVMALHLQHGRYTSVRRQGARVVAMAFSPLRRSELYIALADGGIECVDTATQAQVGALKGHLHAAHTLVCHPHQPLLLSVAGDAAILWRTNDFSRLRALPAATPARTLQHAAFLPSGGGLLTCNERGLRLCSCCHRRRM